MTIGLLVRNYNVLCICSYSGIYLLNYSARLFCNIDDEDRSLDFNIYSIIGSVLGKFALSH